ncbi:MAG: T9SS type A sorting domain-containing protein [Candidatus Kapabacteria bacterium]|nr:T9SS type A sorting domain-containing protein [Candidatus Kapabacteria bacterium]
MKKELLFVISLLLLQIFTYGFSSAYGGTGDVTDFWFSPPPCLKDKLTQESKLRIYILSLSSTPVFCEVPGKGVYYSKQTITNQLTYIDLSVDEAFTYSKNSIDPNIKEKVYQGNGIHVYAEGNFLVYCIIEFADRSEGFQLLPTKALGKEYIVSSYSDCSASDTTKRYPSLTTVTAAFDDTKVTFYLSGNTVTKTAKGLMTGDSEKVILNKGDVWVISSEGPEADLSGSLIRANKPVAVVSGNMEAQVPSDNFGANYLAEMDNPTYRWNKDYPVSVISGRKYASLIRIYAKLANTNIYRDSLQIGTVTNVPGILGKGWFEQRMHPMGIKPHCITISGDNPINVVQFNTGAAEDGNSSLKSFPFQMNLVPFQQFVKTMTFFSPSTYDYKFPEIYLNLIYQTDSSGSMPDDLQIINLSDSIKVWEIINTKYPGTDEILAKSRINIGNRKFALKTIPIINSGVYNIKSNNGFSGYLYGSNNFSSFGYPANSTLMVDQETPDTNSPVPNWVYLSPSKVSGTITDMPNDTAIRSNLARIDFLTDSSYNFNFQYKNFIPGQTVSTTWEADVIDLCQDARALIRFSDRRGNDTIIELNYKAQYIQINPKEINYKTLKMGDEKTMNVEILNSDQYKARKVTQINFYHNNQNFSFDYLPNLPIYLNPLTKLDIIINFKAKSLGFFLDEIYISDGSCTFWETTVKANVADSVNSVEDSENSSLTIFPNPASEIINLKISDSEKCEVGIYNVYGVKVYQSEFRDKIVIRDFPAGIYFIQIGKKRFIFLK